MWTDYIPKAFYNSHFLLNTLLPSCIFLSHLSNVKWTCFSSSASAIVIINLSHTLPIWWAWRISHLFSLTFPAVLVKLPIFEYFLATYTNTYVSFLLLFLSYGIKLFVFTLICRSFLYIHYILTACFSSVL